MAEFIAKNGTKFIYKEEITTKQLLAMQSSIGIGADGKVGIQKSSYALVTALVEKVIFPDGVEKTEAIEIRSIFGDTNSKDGLRLIKLLGKVIGDEENADPKE